MKTLILISLLLLTGRAFSQTTLAATDVQDFAKFMNYCQFPIEREFVMKGVVSLVKYNPDYNNKTLYYVQANNDWMAKYPLVIKWYPIGTKSITCEAYQQEIRAVIKIKVPRLYCATKTEYIQMYYQHYKNGDIQSGWADYHFIGFWDFDR